MSVFTADDMPPIAPGLDPLDDAHPHLRELEALFRPLLDEALRGRCPADPSTVHIRRKEAA